jgi:hypothetical protein
MSRLCFTHLKTSTASTRFDFSASVPKEPHLSRFAFNQCIVPLQALDSHHPWNLAFGKTWSRETFLIWFAFNVHQPCLQGHRVRSRLTAIAYSLHFSVFPKPFGTRGVQPVCKCLLVPEPMHFPSSRHVLQCLVRYPLRLLPRTLCSDSVHSAPEPPPHVPTREDSAQSADVWKVFVKTAHGFVSWMPLNP